MSALAIPTFCGQTGRKVMKAMVTAYLIAGPIDNIINNMEEGVRVFGCTATLTYNLTKTRLDLMARPFVKGLLNVKVRSGFVQSHRTT
jgi:hypothetical protein